MKRLALVLLLMLSFVPFNTACDSTGIECCVICTTSKACGDTCIDRSETCRVAAGCACALQ